MHSAIIEVGNTPTMNNNVEWLLYHCEKIDYFGEHDSWLTDLIPYFEDYGISVDVEHRSLNIVNIADLNMKIVEWKHSIADLLDNDIAGVDYFSLQHKIKTLGDEVMFVYGEELMDSTEFFLEVARGCRNGDKLYIGKVYDYHF